MLPIVTATNCTWKFGVNTSSILILNMEMQNFDNDYNFLDTHYLQEAMTACALSSITHEDVLLLLFRHIAKNLNAPEQRLANSP